MLANNAPAYQELRRNGKTPARNTAARPVNPDQVPSQIVQEQSPPDFRRWHRSMFEEEDPFERISRLEREAERLTGTGPTSLAAARAWAAAWRAS